jgi:hypothetical protein
MICSCMTSSFQNLVSKYRRSCGQGVVLRALYLPTSASCFMKGGEGGVSALCCYDTVPIGEGPTQTDFRTTRTSF